MCRGIGLQSETHGGQAATGYATLEFSPPTLDDKKSFAVGGLADTAMTNSTSNWLSRA
jgi:hypothetical protein